MSPWLKWVARIALTLAVTWIIVGQVGVRMDDALAIDAALPDPSPVWIVGSALLLLAGFLFASRLWGRMVRELGGHDPGFLASSRIFLSANLGRYLPGKLWQMAGLAVLSRRAGVSGAVAASAGILGQAFSLFAAALLALPVLFGSAAPEGADPTIAILVGATALALVSVPGLLGAGLRLVARAARVPPENVPRPAGLFGPRWTLWYLAGWIVYGAAFYVFVRGLGIDAVPRDVVPAFAGAYLLGYLAVFAPAGIGVREGFLIAFLRPSLGGAAVGVAILARLWMTAVELVPAGAMALWEVSRTGAARQDGVAGETPTSKERAASPSPGGGDSR